MTKLVWDDVGEKRYETGVDRGVLYLPDGSAVVWNGITSVDQDRGEGSSTPVYLDGVKYLDYSTPTDYSGTLNAITYPDEFEQFDGVADLENGVYLDGQPNYDTFSLSYRSRIGNDLKANLGYKIHLLYNLTATPTNKTYSTLADDTTIVPLSWAIAGTPPDMTGFRPTSHFIIDSTKLSQAVLKNVETMLYGDSMHQAKLPDPAVLLAL